MGTVMQDIFLLWSLYNCFQYIIRKQVHYSSLSVGLGITTWLSKITYSFEKQTLRQEHHKLHLHSLHHLSTVTQPQTFYFILRFWMFLVSKRLPVYADECNCHLFCAEARVYADTIFAVRQTVSCPFSIRPGGAWGGSELLQGKNWLRGSKVEQWTRSTCGTPEQEAVWLQVASFAAPGLRSLANAQTGTRALLLPGVSWLP